MLEKPGNIWKSNADVICIPTNNSINWMSGRLIMEKGIASDVEEFEELIALTFAHYVKAYGNKPCYVSRCINPNFCSLPIKYNCQDEPDLPLIKQSVKLIVEMMDKDEKRMFEKIALPRPGCEHRELDWENEVKPVIEPLLDDRFVIYSLWR